VIVGDRVKYIGAPQPQLESLTTLGGAVELVERDGAGPEPGVSYDDAVLSFENGDGVPFVVAFKFPFVPITLDTNAAGVVVELSGDSATVRWDDFLASVVPVDQLELEIGG